MGARKGAAGLWTYSPGKVKFLSLFTEMILPCNTPQLNIPNVGRIHILSFFPVPVRKIISVQEIYSDSFFVKFLI